MELKRMLNAPPGIPQDESVIDCLPTCRVCNGPGNGLHYGVNTCDACKGFFHRTIKLKLHLDFKCKNDSTCRIQYGRGKMCQYCRYQKCISVGMSRHAIKTGRYTLSRKADCILEMKKREMMTKCSNKEMSASDDQSTSRPDVPWVDDRSNAPSHKVILSNTASLDDSSLTLSPSQLAALLTPVPSIDSVNTPSTSASFSPHMPDSDAASSSDSNALMQSVVRDLLDTQVKLTSPEAMMLTNPTALTPISGCTTNEDDDTYNNSMTASSLLNGMKQDSRTREKDYCPKNSSNSHTENKDSYSDSPSVILPVMEDNNNPVLKLYIHKDFVIKNLVEAYLTSRDACKRSPEEMVKQSIEYYETCRIKEEMFGRLQKLSEEEYDSVMEQTGIDADGRRSFLSQFLDGMESLLSTMVHFMKGIPGFLSLDLDAQISLVKYNRLEFNLITNYPFSNVELGVVHCQNNKWLCVQEATSSELYQSGKEYINIQGELQNLGLNEEEQAILSAVSAMTPDRNVLTNRSSIHEIYRNLTDVLIYSLGKRHKNPHEMFSTIMQILTRFKQLEVNLKCTIASLNIPKYSQLNKRPLLKEMVTDFYVSPSGT